MPLPMAKDCCCGGPCYNYSETFIRPDNDVELLEPDWEFCGDPSDWSIGSGLTPVNVNSVLVLKHMVGNPYGILSGKFFIEEGEIWHVHVFYGSAEDACSGGDYIVEFEGTTDVNTVAVRIKRGGSIINEEDFFTGGSNEADWTVCVGPNAVEAWVGSASVAVRACGTPNNYWFAIESKTLGAVWDYIQYDDHYAHDRKCPECARGCCFPDWPEVVRGLRVQITGVADGLCDCIDSPSQFELLPDPLGDENPCECSLLLIGPEITIGDCGEGSALTRGSIICDGEGINVEVEIIPQDSHGENAVKWSRTFPSGTDPRSILGAMTTYSQGDNTICDYDSTTVTIEPIVVRGCCSEEEVEETTLSIQKSDISQAKLNKFHSLWEALHSYAPNNKDDWSFTKAQKFYNEWRVDIPRGKCGCKNHWTELVAFNPPNYDSPEKFFEWTWARHDDVSRLHSNAPRITLEEAYALYWT